MLERNYNTNSIKTAKEDLAAAFRLAAYFNLHEGICNHFSYQCNEEGGEPLYLINAYGWHWTEMTPEKLVLIDSNGEKVEGDGEVEPAAKHIHIAAHKANKRHKAVLHVHMPNATALTMLEEGKLEMAHQTACRFYGRIAYEKEYKGFAVSESEGEHIAKEAEKNKNIDCLFLSNHGVVCSGETIAQAFDDLYYLERAAQQQVLAQSTGQKLKLIKEETVKQTANQFQKDFAKYAAIHFECLKRLV